MIAWKILWKLASASGESSDPLRSLTVQGRSLPTACFTASRIAIASSGADMRCPPRHFFFIFLTGHARLISMTS